jgi:hypothetical protein
MFEAFVKELNRRLLARQEWDEREYGQTISELRELRGFALDALLDLEPEAAARYPGRAFLTRAQDAPRLPDFMTNDEEAVCQWCDGDAEHEAGFYRVGPVTLSAETVQRNLGDLFDSHPNEDVYWALYAVETLVSKIDSQEALRQAQTFLQRLRLDYQMHLAAPRLARIAWTRESLRAAGYDLAELTAPEPGMGADVSASASEAPRSNAFSDATK